MGSSTRAKEAEIRHAIQVVGLPAYDSLKMYLVLKGSFQTKSHYAHPACNMSQYEASTLFTSQACFPHCLTQGLVLKTAIYGSAFLSSRRLL